MPRHAIVGDYALSGEAMVGLMARIEAEYPDSREAVARYVPAVISVAPESMEHFLESLERDHGTFDELAAALGVGDAVKRLRAAVLVAP